MNVEDMVEYCLGWVMGLWDTYGWKLLFFPLIGLLAWMVFKGDL